MDIMFDLVNARKKLQRKLGMLEARFQAIQEPASHGHGWGQTAAAIDQDAVLERLSEALGIEIKLVRQALQRLENGAYGSCLVCGDPIEMRRLHALPEASTCRDCAEEEF